MREAWSNAPWRCRHGWHKWAFVSMSNVRQITVPPHSTWVCELVEKCRLCKLRHSYSSAPVPKKVKVQWGTGDRIVER